MQAERRVLLIFSLCMLSFSDEIQNSITVWRRFRVHDLPCWGTTGGWPWEVNLIICDWPKKECTIFEFYVHQGKVRNLKVWRMNDSKEEDNAYVPVWLGNFSIVRLYWAAAQDQSFVASLALASRMKVMVVTPAARLQSQRWEWSHGRGPGTCCTTLSSNEVTRGMASPTFRLGKSGRGDRKIIYQ